MTRDLGIARFLPALVLVGALALRVAEPAAVEDLRFRVFDGFQRLQPRPAEAMPVRVVDLDDATLTRFGQWPWPRTQVAALIRRLADAGAAAIALDIVFAEPDRTSPRHVLSLWPSSQALEALQQLAAGLPDHDAAFAEAIGRAPVVTGFALTNDANGVQPAVKANVAFAGEEPSRSLLAFPGAVVNLPALEVAASGNGHFNPLPERDGLIRRIPLFLRRGDAMQPALVLEALRVAQGASTYIVKSAGASGEWAFGQRTGLTHVKVGRLTIPTDAHGRLWIWYRRDATGRVIPAWQVLEGLAPPDAFAGQVVFLGTSATGLKDLRATPLNPVAAGVEIHAEVAEQILAGDFLERPDWADGAEIVYLLLLGVGLLLLLPRVGPAWCAALGLGAVAAAFGASWMAFARWGWLLDPVFPALAVLALYLVSSLLNFLRSEAERRHVREAFSRYLSPILVERLAQHPDQLVLGGETRTMTLLFADIRGFTTIAEQHDAQSLTRFMNRFLTPMTRLILERQGTIDKYMGDCIMAFWNAPLDDPDHARHACEAALAMRDYLVGWNETLRQETQRAGRTFVPVRLGVGLNTGECCVGNVGSEQRFDYSVLGDEVNLASRLEGQSKRYGVDIVIGEHTDEQITGLAALELDLIRVKGKTRPVRIYGLLGGEAMGRDERFAALRQRHQAFLAAYRTQRWEEARGHLAACRAMGGAFALTGLYDVYGERLAFFASHTPGPGWNGVFAAETK